MHVSLISVLLVQLNVFLLLIEMRNMNALLYAWCRRYIGKQNRPEIHAICESGKEDKQ